MVRTISRRGLFAAAAAGFAAPTALRFDATVAAQSPPERVIRDLKPGTSQLRLSAQVNPRLTAVKDNDYATFFSGLRAGGWSAVEAASDAWLSRPRLDSEIREVKAAAKANNVVFYGLHCAGNI